MVMQTNPPDWRGQLRKNDRKTRWVIAVFIGLYVLVGLLVDCFVYNRMYGMRPEIVLQLIFSFRIIPYATLIMGGIAALSLWITYTFYDRLMLLGTEYVEVTRENARSMEEQQLYNVVEEMKVAAGLAYMPKVYIIEADYMNAFASGYSEKSAMVAITRGLIMKLDRAELQAVMAHELSHIRHQDIKLTLTVAVLSNLMLMVVDLLFYSVLYTPRNDNEERRDNRLLIVILVLRYVLPLLTVLLTLFMSRTRELMADSGCVELTRNNEPLARALMKISDDHSENADYYANEYTNTPHENVRRAAYIFDPVSAGLDAASASSSLFSTHPSLEERLNALGYKRKN